jgi:hypothetical protein
LLVLILWCFSSDLIHNIGLEIMYILTMESHMSMPTFEGSWWAFLALNSCHSGLKSPWGSLDLEPSHKLEGVYKK